MKKPILAALLLLAWKMAPQARAQVVIASSFADHVNVTINGAAIETSGTVEVPDGSVVKFRGTTSVTLKPGFKAETGSRFRAFIFVDTDGDGMDDAWEVTYGLNPANAADAAGNLDGDTLTNLQEYLLGTSPTATNTSGGSSTGDLKVHRPPQ